MCINGKGSIDAIIYGTDDKYTRINKPYVYKGKYILDTNEIAINKNFADAHSLKIGDKIELNFSINNESKTESFIIASLVSYPNYVFLLKMLAFLVDAKLAIQNMLYLYF